MGRIPDEAAPCGVFCGACPSYGKSCLGCGSDLKQRRRGKFRCKIRNCCFEDKNLDFCIECTEFPCQLLEKKLKNSHPGEARFKYRHEIYDNLERIKEIGVENWVEEQRNRFKCPKCNGSVTWYVYKCKECEFEYSP